MIIALVVGLLVVGLGLWATVLCLVDLLGGRAYWWSILIVLFVPIIGPLWYIISRDSRRPQMRGI